MSVPIGLRYHMNETEHCQALSTLIQVCLEVGTETTAPELISDRILFRN